MPIKGTSTNPCTCTPIAKVALKTGLIGNDTVFYLECEECNFTAARGLTLKNAIANWNARRTEQPREKP